MKQTKKVPQPATPAAAPWGPRILWGAIGLVGGYAAGLLLSLLLLSLVGRGPAMFVFRVFAYGGIFVGLDFAGERARWKISLLRGLGLGAAIAVLRTLLGRL